MTRRETIISAALINAALLVVLFVCALSVDESMERGASHASFVPSIQTIPDGQTQEGLPKATSPEFQEIQLIASPSSQLREVIVQKGDRLDTIAKRCNTTPEQLVEVNRLNTTQLVVGQKLQLPASSGPDAAPRESANQEQRARESAAPTPIAVLPVAQAKASTDTTPQVKKATRSQNSTSSSAKSAPPSGDSAPQYHYVQKGESPWLIAKKYNMSVDKLLKINHLDEATARRLREGDRLRVR